MSPAERESLHLLGQRAFQPNEGDPGVTGRWQKDSFDSEMLASVFGERFDRLMTVEIRPVTGGLPPGLVVRMYEACRRYHGEPLSTLAARRLAEVLGDGATVLIVTGFGVPPNLPCGETDGPPGAAVLARALAKGFGAHVVLVTEQAHLAPIAATGKLLGNTLNGFGSITVESFPVGIDAGRLAAAGLIGKHRPAAVIFVERPGPNAEGYFHGIRGDCGSPEGVGHLYLLADATRGQGVLTIGIGDGGNEVGFGAVRQEIAASLPFAGRCLNGCPSGVVTVITTDIMVSASVSNWGAYGVAAALAVLRREPDLLHTPEIERELIAVSVAAGARDGATFAADLLVDGIDWKGHASFVGLLRSIVSTCVVPQEVPAHGV